MGGSSLKVNIFREAHHLCVMESQNGGQPDVQRQRPRNNGRPCSRPEFFNIIFCIFPANDSISTSLASPPPPPSPLHYHFFFQARTLIPRRDGLFWSCQVFTMKSSHGLGNTTHGTSTLALRLEASDEGATGPSFSRDGGALCGRHKAALRVSV